MKLQLVVLAVLCVGILVISGCKCGCSSQSDVCPMPERVAAAK